MFSESVQTKYDIHSVKKRRVNPLELLAFTFKHNLF